jgi:hypothetical protein
MSHRLHQEPFGYRVPVSQLVCVRFGVEALWHFPYLKQGRLEAGSELCPRTVVVIFVSPRAATTIPLRPGYHGRHNVSRLRFAASATLRFFGRMTGFGGG